jgi:OmpA family protein
VSNDQDKSISILKRTKPVEIGIGRRLCELYKIGQIYFPTAGHTLDDQDKDVLKKISASYQILLLGNPTLSLYFVGYADHRGSQGYNLDLSKKRAESVAGYIKNRGAFKNNRTWNCIIEPKGEKDSYQRAGSSHLNNRKNNIIRIMKLERHVDIYSDICAAPAPLKIDDLEILVKNKKTKKVIKNAVITLEDGARSKRRKTDSRGMILIEDIDIGKYSVLCDDENYKMVSWKNSSGKEADNSDKAKVEIKGGIKSKLEIKLLKQMRLPKKWIQKIYISKAGPKEPEFKTRTTVVEEYEVVTEDKIEKRAARKNWMLEEIGILGPLSRYQIWRFEATYGYPDTKDKLGKFWDQVGNVISFFTRDADEEVDVYRSWKAYPKRKGDLLEKYRPKK